MGTNFYIAGYIDHDDPRYHIGKRSAAGLYCYDCGVTLCKGGEDAIHESSSSWHDACPKCGKTHEKEPLEDSAVGRELGFNKRPPTQETGVKGCSSFTWAMDPNKLRDPPKEIECPTCGHTTKVNEGAFIVDEYGGKYTVEQFMDMLDKTCPVRLFNSIGDWFS